MPFKQSMMQAPARHSRGKRVVKCNAPPHVQEVKCAIPNKRGEAMERPALNYSLPGKPNKGKKTTNTSQKQYSLLLTILVFTAVATYAGLYNYPTIFPLNDKSTKHLGRSINGKDVLFSPRLLPNGFWFLTATTLTFVSSVVSIFVAICLDGCKCCAFGVRVLSSFVLTALFVSYVVMVKQVVPQFVVITGNGHILITGFEMLCLCTLLLALLSLAVALMVRWLWSFVRRSGRAMVGKVVGELHV
nr:Ankyrin repeat-containing protein [Ipomoea batatas]